MNKPTHDSWGRKIWYPADEPYRVLPTYRSSQPGCFGWIHGTPQTFATEREAREAAASISNRGLIRLVIDKAENAETWRKNGRWKQVARLR